MSWAVWAVLASSLDVLEVKTGDKPIHPNLWRNADINHSLLIPSVRCRACAHCRRRVCALLWCQDKLRSFQHGGKLNYGAKDLAEGCGSFDRQSNRQTTSDQLIFAHFPLVDSLTLESRTQMGTATWKTQLWSVQKKSLWPGILI